MEEHLFKWVIILFWYLKAPCKISESQDNPFWEENRVHPQKYHSGGYQNIFKGANLFFGNGGPHAEEIQVFTSLLSCNEWKAVEKGTESTKTILPGPGSLYAYKTDDKN